MEGGTGALLRVAARLDVLLRTRVALAVIVIAIAVHCGIMASRRMPDFKVYHLAAQRLVANEPIYRLDDAHRYLYAPVVTFLFVPLAPLPRIPAGVIWYAANLWLLWASLGLIERMVFRESRPPPGFRLIVVLFSLRFIDNNLGHGQINILLFWLVLVAYDAAGRGKTWWAGLALAGAIAMKFYPAVLLFHLALARRWRFLATTLLAGAALLVLPAVWWGDAYPDELGRWLGVVRDQAGHYDVANKINQSIAAFAHRLFSPNIAPDAAIALHAAFLVVLAIVALRSRRTEPPEGEDAAALALYLLYGTVASQYSWKYYFVALMLPAAVVFRRIVEGRQPGGVGVLAAAFLLNLLPGLRLFGRELATLFQLWSFHFLSVVVLFVAIFAARRRTAVVQTAPFSRSEAMSSQP
jgi:hypothetical protein